MLSKNGSYFDPELLVDGQYIITGRTNDQFCLDNLELTDVQTALHQYLRYDQGFQAVFFLDNRFALYCMDQQSYDILTGTAHRQQQDAAAPAAGGIYDAGRIRASGPLGTHRRRRRAAPDGAAPVPASAALLHTRTFSMGHMSVADAWNQLYTVLQRNEHCALILTNPNLLAETGGEKLLMELPSSYNKRVVFIDRSPAECYNSFRVLWIGCFLLPQRRFVKGSTHSFFVEMLIS